MYSLRIINKVKNIRLFSTIAPIKHNLEELKSRSLIRVSGPEVSDYLQGLITNDVNHLSGGVGCIYAMFLNVKGRVLYDSIIYREDEGDTLLIECDKEAVSTLSKHLKMHKVRRKIDISNVDDYNIYAIFNTNSINEEEQQYDVKRVDGNIVPCNTLNESGLDVMKVKQFKDLLIFRDPRTSYLGSRILVPKECNALDQISQLYELNSENKESYQSFRYKLGVGEGVQDLPPSNCFPLEANADYLHGVSFHKGCYVGQELTARSHHTGVIRKRLMPLYFTKLCTNLPKENTIVNNEKNLGKLRGICNENLVGLGLLRINLVLDLKEFTVGNGVASTVKPVWWPIEAPKESRLEI